MRELILMELTGVVLSASCKKKEEITPASDNGSTGLELADFTINWIKNRGTTSEDDFSGGVVDNSGNFYFVGSTQPDGYTANIFVSKVNLNNQNVEWTRSFDAGDRDYQPSPSENSYSQGGGGARCICFIAAYDSRNKRVE